MTTEQTKETATTQTANEQPNKTRVQDTQEFKDALSRATSTYQKQASDARKESRGLATEITKLTTRVTDTERQVELAKIAGDDDEAKTAAEKLLDFRAELTTRQSTLEEREGRVGEIERTSTIRLLSEQYGIPQADLESYDTVSEMEIAALKHKLESNGTSSTEVATVPAEVEKESKAIEAGEGLTSKGPMPDPIKEPQKFRDFADNVIAEARVRKG